MINLKKNTGTAIRPKILCKYVEPGNFTADLSFLLSSEEGFPLFVTMLPLFTYPML
jgi:hypothetical protein